MLRSKIAKILLLVLVLAVVVAAVVACSPRGDIDPSITPSNSENVSKAVSTSKSEANKLIVEGMNNRINKYATDGSEEWYVVDLTFDFLYNDYTGLSTAKTAYNMVLQANMHLSDNAKSELLLEVTDNITSALVLGVYYVNQVLYVTVLPGLSGYPDMNYYMPELNLTSIGQALSGALSGLNLDPLVLIASVLGAQSKIGETFGTDDGTGVKSIQILGTSLDSLINTLAQPLIFDTGVTASSVEVSADGKQQVVSVPVQANTLLGYLVDASALGTFVAALKDTPIGWELFGLPDLDPVLEQFLGFSFRTIREKDWPPLLMLASTVNNYETIVRADGSTYDGYVLDGLRITIDALVDEKHPKKEFDLTIEISPFTLAKTSEPLNISFSGKGLTTSGTKYKEGGLLNLEADMSIEVEAADGAVLTLGDVLGDAIDLGAIGNIPFKFGANNEAGDKCYYEFNAVLKADIDMFNGENNRIEFNLTYDAGGASLQPIASIYMIGDSIYVDTTAIGGQNYALPNLKVSGLDITELLFSGDAALLKVVMPYLDPSYAATATEDEATEGGAAGVSNSAVANAGTGFNFSTLMGALINYYDVVDEETGEVITPASFILPILSSDPDNTPLKISLSNQALNTILNMFLDEPNIGLYNVSVSVPLSTTAYDDNEDSVVKIQADLTEDIGIKIKVNSAAYMGRPDFTYDSKDEIEAAAAEGREYQNIFGDNVYHIELGGRFDVAVNKTTGNDAVSVDLGGMLSGVLSNLLINLGVTDYAHTGIGYKVLANFDVANVTDVDLLKYVSFAGTQLVVYLYLPTETLDDYTTQSFLSIMYDGGSDYLYLDLSQLSRLQSSIPLFKIISQDLKNIKIKLGLEGKLQFLNSLTMFSTDSTQSLASYAMSGTPYQVNQIDALSLIGDLLSGVMISDNTMQIIASSQMLNVLMRVLGVSLAMPEVKLSIAADAISNDSNLIKIHFGLIDGKSNTQSEFLTLDMVPFSHAQITAGSGSLNFDINREFVTSEELLANLLIKFELSGALDLQNYASNYEGFDLSGVIGELLGSSLGSLADILKIYVETKGLDVQLSFNIKANLDLSGIAMQNGALSLPNIGKSSAAIEVESYDAASGATDLLLGIYLKDGTLYLQLDGIGMQNLKLEGIGAKLLELVNGTTTGTTPTQQAMTAAQNAANSAFDFGNIGMASNAVALAVQIWISPYSATISVAGDQITTLLAELLGLKQNTITVRDVVITGDISDGIALEIATGIETIDLSLSLFDLGIWFGENTNAYNISLPTGSESWAGGNLDTLLESLHVSLSGSFYFDSTPATGTTNRLDLSGLIGGLMPGVDINTYLDFLGVDCGTEITFAVDAYLNLSNIMLSTFRLELAKDGSAFLTAIYKGYLGADGVTAHGDLYVKSSLFGISPDQFTKLPDVTNLFGGAGSATAVIANSATYTETASAVSNLPAYASYVDYIKLTLADGKLALAITEDVLSNLFASLGVDLGSFFDQFDLSVKAEIDARPISLSLQALINGVELGLSIGNLGVDFSTASAITDDYLTNNVELSGFNTIGIDITATVSALAETVDDVYFNDLVGNLLSGISGVSGIDKDMMSKLGILLQMVGDTEGDKWGGTLYVRIEAMLNLANINNMYLALKLGTDQYLDGNGTLTFGDVLDISVYGGTNTDGSMTADIYVDIENLTGITPFIVNDVKGIIDSFTSTVSNSYLSVAQETADGTANYGEAMPALIRMANSAAADEVLLSQILIQIASEDTLLSAPIVASVSSGAIYAILSGLAGIDIQQYLSGHNPEVKLSLLGDPDLVALEAKLTGVLSLGFSLQSPGVKLNPQFPSVPSTEKYSNTLSANDLVASVEIEGEVSFSGTADGTAADNIQIDSILQSLKSDITFGVLISLLESFDARVTYRLAASVDIKALLAGDWNGLDASLEFRNNAGEVVLGLYYFDENGDGQNDLLLDLEKIHVGKMRINSFASLMSSVIAPTAASQAYQAAQAVAPSNAEGDAEDNTALLQAYVNLRLGMDKVLSLNVSSDVFALLITALNVTDGNGNRLLDGDEIVSTFNDILSLDVWMVDTDGNGLFDATVRVSNYNLNVNLGSVGVQFAARSSSQLVGADFDVDSFGEVGASTQDIYLKLAFELGWNLKAGTQVDFTDLLSSVLSINNLALAPVISILEDAGQNFTFEIEAKIHFGNLLANGALLNDLLFDVQNGRYDGISMTTLFANGNMATLTTSDGRDVLIIRSGTAGAYTYQGVDLSVLLQSQLCIALYNEKGEEVVALRFVDGNLYVNLEVFGLGKFVISNAYSYLLELFTPLTGVSSLGYTLAGAPASQSAADTARYAADATSVISQFINVNVSPEAFAIQVSSASIFAILKVVGLDVNNIALSDSLSLDLQSAVDSLGELNVGVNMLTDSDLLELKLALNEWMLDPDGNKLTNPDQFISLRLALTNDFVVGLTAADVHNIAAPSTSDYDNFDEANMSIETQIQIHYGMETYSNANVNKEPLSGLLGKYLSDLIIQLGVYIVGDQEGTVTADIRLNIQLIDLINEIMGGNLTLRSIQAEIDLSYNDDTFVVIKMFYGNTYVDLTALNGPKIYLDNLAGLFGASSSTVDTTTPAAVSQTNLASTIANAPNNALNEDANVMPISIDLLNSGLYVVLKNAAFNALFALLGLNDFEMFESLTTTVSATEGDPLTLGLSIDLRDQSTDFLSLGIVLNGLSVRMSSIPTVTTAGDDRKPMAPPSTQEQKEYKSLTEINTVTGSTSFEMSFTTVDGAYQFAQLINSLWDATSVLGKGLAPVLTLEDVLGDTIRIDLDMAFNVSFYETVRGAHLYDNSATGGAVTLLLNGITYNVVGSAIRNSAGADVGTFNRAARTFTLNNTNYSFTDDGVVKVSKGISRILEGIQVKAHIYSLNNQDYFDINIYFVKGVAYIDAECLGISKVKVAINSITDLISMFTSGSTSAAAAPTMISNSADAYYAGMEQTFAAPLSALNAAGKTVGLVDVMFNKDGVFATVGASMVYGILGLVGLNDQMLTAIENTAAPEIRVSIDQGVTLALGVDLLAVTSAGVTPAQATLGAKLITANTKVGVEVDSSNLDYSVITPLISAEEAALYTSFDELEIYAEVNMTLSLELLRGYINLDQILDLIIATMSADINIVETHQIDVAISGRIGLSLANFLSRDAELIKKAFYAQLAIDFIIDNGTSPVFIQRIMEISVIDSGVYATIRLFDSTINARIPDFTLGAVLYDLIGLTTTDAASPASSVSSEMPSAVATMPLAILAEASQAGTTILGGDALEVLVSLNSKELAINLSVVLVTTALSALGLGDIDLTAVVSSVFSGGKVAINYLDDFFIFININKQDDQANDIGGYSLSLKLLHDTYVDLSGASFAAFVAELTAPAKLQEMQTYAAFDLMAMLDSSSNYDILDFIGKIGASVDIKLSADLKRYLIDWRKLFEDNNIDSLFYIQINEALQGSATLNIAFDVNLQQLLKGKLALDLALTFIDTNGNSLMSVAIRGLGRDGDSAVNDLTVIVHVLDTPMPDFVLSGEDIDAFVGLNYNALIDGLLSGLGLTDTESDAGTSSIANAAADSATIAPRNALLGDENGFMVLDTVNLATILENLSFVKGKLSIIITRNIVQELLLALFGFPFDDIDDVSVSLDVIENEFVLNFSLAAFADTDETAMGFTLYLGSLNVAIGGRELFASNNFLNDASLPLSGFDNLRDLKMQIELVSELSITDELISYFDLSETTSPLLGMNVVLQSGEQLNIIIECVIKLYIDFSDIRNIALQLGFVYEGKQYLSIIYKGDIMDSNATAYVDLSGLGLPSIALPNINLGAMVRDLLSGLGSSDDTTGASSVSATMLSQALAAYDEGTAPLNGDVGGVTVDIPAEDVQFGTALLLLTVSSREAALSITGALAASLIHGLTSAVVIPEFNTFTVGYIDDEDGTLIGLRVVLDEAESFTIQYSFTQGGSFSMSRDTVCSIDPYNDLAGHAVEVSEIDVLKNVHLALHAEVRLKTTDDDGTGKSDQIEALEALVEGLIGMSAGSFDFSLQSSSMVFTFDIEMILNLADPAKTQLYLEIGYGDVLLVGVYYTLVNESDGVPQAYVDLSGLGLFQAAVTGIDLVGIVGNLLDSFVTDEGLNIGELLSGLLSGGSEASAAAPAADSGNVALEFGAQNAPANAEGTAQATPTLNVIFTNSELSVVPNMAVLEKLTGIDLPSFLDLRVVINLKEGLNNLTVKLKIDKYSNSLQLSIPVENGLKLGLNYGTTIDGVFTSAQLSMPTNFTQYGGVNGVAMGMSGGSLNVSVGTRGLINSIVDSLYTEDLTLTLEKRNSYWARTAVSKWFGINTYVSTYGPTVDPLSTKGYFGSGDYKTYRYIEDEDFAVKRSVLSVSRSKTNVLEADINLNNSGLGVIVAYNEGRINLKIPNLVIKVSVGSLLSAIPGGNIIATIIGNPQISINVGAILNTFVPNGINVYTLILNTLIAENRTAPSTLGTVYGTVEDVENSPMSGVTVKIAPEGTLDTAAITTTTDSYGNYSFVGLNEGKYEILFEKPGYDSLSYKNIEVKGQAYSAATLKNATMAVEGGTVTYHSVSVSGTVVDENATPVKGAQIYLDGVAVTTTAENGTYSFYREEMFGENHSVGVSCVGYDSPAELAITVGDAASVTGVDFAMQSLEETGTTLIQGVLQDAEGNPLSISDTELWIAFEMPSTGFGYETHLKDEAVYGRNLDPVNFFDSSVFNVKSDISGRFWVYVPNSYLTTATYKFKFRSLTYVNRDIIVSGINVGETNYITDAAGADVNVITLAKREAHWSADTLATSPIAGIRVRLGADSLDEDIDVGTETLLTNLAYGVEEAGDSTNDSVSYVELWLNSDLIGNLLGKVMALIGGTTAGFSTVTTDARIQTKDLVVSDTSAGVRRYYENDLTVYDYRYANRSVYAIAAHAMITKLPATFLATILGPLIKNNVSAFVAKLIEFAAENLLGDVLAQVGDNVAAVLQFPLPHNILGEAEMANNLLTKLMDYNYAAYDDVVATDGVDKDGDGIDELTREVAFQDRSVYVKLKLNAQADALIEAVSIFINGVYYAGEQDAFTINTPVTGFGELGIEGGYIDVSAGAFMPYEFVSYPSRGEEKSGTEKVVVMENGVVNSENLAYVRNWIAHAAIESYFIVEDKDADGNVVDRFYVLAHEPYVKRGAYMEINLINTGLSLRAGATELGVDSKYFNWTTGGNNNYTAPYKIVFHDPYDPTDFTFYGGSWANEGSGIRTNTDTTKTVYDFLPERYDMDFVNGTSTGSNGVGVFWSYDSVDFDPEGGTYNLIGACLNKLIAIEAVVEPRVVDPSKVDELVNLPALDPLNYDSAAYLQSLPTSFAEPEYTTTVDGKIITTKGYYVFNSLEWDMSDTKINFAGGTTTIGLTYSMKGTTEDSTYQSAKATIQVPVKVLNRTVTSVDNALEGSVNGINGGIVYFDPYLENDPVTRIRALASMVITTAEGDKQTVDITGYDTGSMWNYRGAAGGEQQYTIYYRIVDALGRTQNVPVIVKISSKKITSTTVSELSVAARTIIPYTNSGIYHKDLGLSLANTVLVTYEDETTKLLTENVDFVWGVYRADDANKTVYYKENFASVFTATVDATYVLGIYSIDAQQSVNATNAYADAKYFTELYVAKRVLTSAPMLTLQPDNDFELPDSYGVYFNGSAVPEIANVTWSLTASDLLASFNGGIYAGDLSVSGALFETQTIPNVRVDVAQIVVGSVDFGAYTAINPFDLTTQLRDMFGAEGVTLRVAGSARTIAADKFDIVSYEILSGSDLDTSTSVSLLLTIGNEGYSVSNPSTQVWSQTVIQSVNLLDVSDLIITSPYVDPVNPNLSGDYTDSVYDVIKIHNAYNGVLPEYISFAVDGVSKSFGIKYDVASLPEDIYTKNRVSVKISPDAWPQATKTVTLLIANALSPLDETDITFPDAVWSQSALAPIRLPSLATVAFGAGELDGVVSGSLPVTWTVAGGTQSISAAQDSTLTLVGRVGKLSFGYVSVTKTLTLTADSVTESGLPDTIEINPLTGERLTAVSATTAGGARTLSVVYPDSLQLTYTGGNYDIAVQLAQQTVFANGTLSVYVNEPANVTVLSRRAVAMKTELVGTAYSPIDFSTLDTATVVLDNGEELTTSIVWSGIDNLRYTVQGGVSYVTATIFSGVSGLQQSFRVAIRIKQAALEGVYYVENGAVGAKISELSVDPYEGFTDLPATVFAKFYNISGYVLIAVDWTVAHVVNSMSVSGGSYTAEQNNAAEVTVYLTDADGERYAQQTLQINVNVADRSIVATGDQGGGSYQTVGVEFTRGGRYTRTETDWFNLNGGATEIGDELPVFDRGTNTVTMSMYVNPYLPATGVKYNEDKTAADFYYFQAIRLTLAGGVTKTFELSSNEIVYRIYDADTKLATVTNNLYTGRNVTVEMYLNSENIYDANGDQVLAADAGITLKINVRIMNMTYESGEFRTEYTVDMYNEWFGSEYVGVVENYIGVSTLNTLMEGLTNPVLNVNEKTDNGMTTVTYSPDTLTFDITNINKNFDGDTGTVYAQFGDDLGGKQRVAITLNYLQRNLSGVFNATATTTGGYSTGTPNFFTNLDSTANRTALGLKDTSLVRITNNGKLPAQAFLLDPFAAFDGTTFFPATSDYVSFDDGTADGKLYSNTAVAITWNYSKLFIDYYGGVFNVTATIGEGEAQQSVSYRMYILSRKVKASNANGDSPFSNLVREDFAGIRAYNYIYSGDVEADLAADVFRTGYFEIAFEEGSAIRYGLGESATTGILVSPNALLSDLDSALTPAERDKQMSFNLDGGQGLNSNGRAVRFYISVPGYGLGNYGAQTVPLFLDSIAEKIVDARAIDGTSAIDFASYWNDAINVADAMTKVDDHTFHITNPYYFIKRGGITMPDKVRVYVNQSGDGAAAAEAYYDVSVSWNNSNGNVIRLYYYAQEVSLNFNIELDNQLYDKLRVTSTPFILNTGANGVVFNSGSYLYGEDEVILLPVNSQRSSIVQSVLSVEGLDVNGYATDDYAYRIVYNGTTVVDFADINGGGTIRNDVNKWCFSNVMFSYAPGVDNTQYATITLGGRGGQQIKWALKTVDKILVNNSISTVQVFTAGGNNNGVNFDAIGGDANRLPTTVTQYFDTNLLYSGVTGYGTTAVPVTYSTMLNGDLQTAEYYSDTSRPQFTLDSGTLRVTATSTAATTVRKSENDNVGVGVVKWSATTKRAYPAPKKDISGYIYMLYDTQGTATPTTNTYLINPTREGCTFESLVPSLGGDWVYPADLGAINGLADDGSLNYDDMSYYIDINNNYGQTAVPIISVKANVVFDTACLPLFEVELNGTKYINFVDWNNAEVYFTDKPGNSAYWSYNNTDYTLSAFYNASMKVANGIKGINTSTRGINGATYRSGRYTLVAHVPGVAGKAGTVIVALDIA